MNKTDRELLEAAAKAAGIKLRYWSESQESFNLALTEPRRWWNPLADDGDALRLAVRLNIEIIPQQIWVWAVHPSVHNTIKEPPGADPYAATRRAIVRAATAMGENKNGNA